MLLSTVISSGCYTSNKLPITSRNVIIADMKQSKHQGTFQTNIQPNFYPVVLQHLSIYLLLSRFICGLRGIISILNLPSLLPLCTTTHSHTLHISQPFALTIMHLGSAPAWLKLINSGFNSTECWLQTLWLCVLKHAPSSLIIKMCVLEKLMNKSLGRDYDWCVRGKQATIGCCWNRCGGQTNCRWTNCWIRQTEHPSCHMCIIFPDDRRFICGLFLQTFFVPQGFLSGRGSEARCPFTERWPFASWNLESGAGAIIRALMERQSVSLLVVVSYC